LNYFEVIKKMTTPTTKTKTRAATISTGKSPPLPFTGVVSPVEKS
jgi:hypothetical protein